MSSIVIHVIFMAIAIFGVGLVYSVCSAQWVKTALWRLWTTIVLVLAAFTIYVAIATSFGYFDLMSLRPLFDGWNKQSPPPFSYDLPIWK